MKKILIIIDWFLPGYKGGGPISSNANLLDHLASEYEFYVITRDTDYCEQTPYPEVNSDAWNTLANGAQVYYFSSGKLSLRNLIKVSKNLAFDTVYINGIYSFYFSLFPLIWFKYVAHRNVVVAARGMLSDHTFSSKKGKKQLFYAFARMIRLYKGITFHATNDEEARQIRKNVGFNGTIHVAPNLPPKVKSLPTRTIRKKPGEVKLVSIARISPEKNTLFALKVLEACNLQPATCNLTFDLYGTIYDQAYWEKCRQVISRLPSTITVHYCGPLEKEKIPATLQQYHFLFMPSQGENYGHSIVESFIAGCPVIISDRTPWRNLAGSSSEHAPNLSPHPVLGWDLPLEQPRQFVDVIAHCTGMDQEEYDAMCQSASVFAEHITSNAAVLEANRQLFK